MPNMGKKDGKGHRIPTGPWEPFQEKQYKGWRANRLAVWIDHYGAHWFKGKRILEVGAGYGDIGNTLAQLGAEVDCTDAQERFVEKCKERHPQVNAYQLDVEKGLPDKNWDMIISTGLLYHLSPKGVQQHIKDLCTLSTTSIVETLVVDSDDPTRIEEFPEPSRRNPRTAFNDMGSRFSPAYIESLLDECRSVWFRENSRQLNSPFIAKGGIESGHIYDWQVKNTGKWRIPQYRRMWYVERRHQKNTA